MRMLRHPQQHHDSKRILTCQPDVCKTSMRRNRSKNSAKTLEFQPFAADGRLFRGEKSVEFQTKKTKFKGLK